VVPSSTSVAVPLRYRCYAQDMSAPAALDTSRREDPGTQARTAAKPDTVA
jgi:hypothetical protein